jgi:hypothetical protein
MIIVLVDAMTWSNPSLTQSTPSSSLSSCMCPCSLMCPSDSHPRSILWWPSIPLSKPSCPPFIGPSPLHTDSCLTFSIAHNENMSCTYSVLPRTDPTGILWSYCSNIPVLFWVVNFLHVLFVKASIVWFVEHIAFIVSSSMLFFDLALRCDSLIFTLA